METDLIHLQYAGHLRTPASASTTWTFCPQRRGSRLVGMSTTQWIRPCQPRGQTWLITGGAGYIGAHVVHAMHPGRPSPGRGRRPEYRITGPAAGRRTAGDLFCPGHRHPRRSDDPVRRDRGDPPRRQEGRRGIRGPAALLLRPERARNGQPAGGHASHRRPQAGVLLQCSRVRRTAGRAGHRVHTDLADQPVRQHEAGVRMAHPGRRSRPGTVLVEPALLQRVRRRQSVTR